MPPADFKHYFDCSHRSIIENFYNPRRERY
jgi:hypothetical protein